MLIPAWVIIITITIIGLYFRKRQKTNKLGGQMALSKSIWLNYTIISWFILPLYFYFFTIEKDLNFILITLSLSMWTRGIIELAMLYHWKNWKAKYGIVHDIFTLILIIIISILNPDLILLEFVYLLSIILSLILETGYAVFFQRYIGLKTQGDKAIWFANKEDPLYKKNLQVTTFGNILLYSTLFYYLLNQ